jgi:hypothetical protein
MAASAELSRPLAPEAEINIPISSLPTYECGAILFSYLAFPEPDAEARRAQVHAALCHLGLQAIGQDDPDGRWLPQLIKPGYALLRESDVRAAVKTMDRRLRDRLDAAIVAKPFLEQTTTGLTPTLPPGVNQLSIEGMAKYVLFRAKSDTDRGDVKNFHARVWRQSLPVIHLAVALNTLFERTIPAGLGKLAIHDLIRSPEAIEFLVETAQPLEPIFPRISKFGLDEDTLIRFRLT